MITLEIDWHDECHIRVSWFQRGEVKRRIFDSRDEAERFAESKMGKTGCVISNLDMTAEQYAAHKAHQLKLAQAFAAYFNAQS